MNVQILDLPFILGRHANDRSHASFIREQLVRMVPAILPDVIDEINLAVPESIPARDDGV